MAKRGSKKISGDTVLNEALERFEETQSATNLNRLDAAKDIRFGRLADQWPAEIRKQRELEGRPCLTINRMPAFVRQVVNDARQNKPAIQVVPVDSGADIDTAEVIGGLCRAIERGSNAEVAYDTALEHAVSGGFGFFRIGIDYAQGDTFEHNPSNPANLPFWNASCTNLSIKREKVGRGMKLPTYVNLAYWMTEFGEIAFIEHIVNIDAAERDIVALLVERN